MAVGLGLEVIPHVIHSHASTGMALIHSFVTAPLGAFVLGLPDVVVVSPAQELGPRGAAHGGVDVKGGKSGSRTTDQLPGFRHRLETTCHGWVRVDLGLPTVRDAMSFCIESAFDVSDV